MVLDCPECDGKMSLRNSKHGPFYGCSNYPQCKAAHGAHPDGKPLGVPANKETKQWRIKAHDAFDKLWNFPGGRKHRGAAYGFLRRKMGLTHEECHIGKFDQQQCEQVIAVCSDLTEWEVFKNTKPVKVKS